MGRHFAFAPRADVGMRAPTARFGGSTARGGAETRPRKIPRAADDDAKPAGAPDELELKDFLEEYFTHGDACPCYESTDADARADGALFHQPSAAAIDAADTPPPPTVLRGRVLYSTWSTNFLNDGIVEPGGGEW